MALSITLNEDDMRDMPSDLREKFLKWYFNREIPISSTVSSKDSGLLAALTPISIRPRREESGRFTFPEFVRLSLLAPGDELFCKALKRQKRSGGETYVDAGKVMEDGHVSFRGLRYDVPSKLAVDVVNAHGGKTPALNGYDYIFARHSKKLVSLRELRDRVLGD